MIRFVDDMISEDVASKLANKVNEILWQGNLTLKISIILMI